MTAGIVPGRQPAQLDEFEAQRLEVRDVAVQRGPVGDRTHQQGVDAGLDALERLQRCGQRGRDPARDPEGVVSGHVCLPFRGIACGSWSGHRGDRVSCAQDESSGSRAATADAVGAGWDGKFAVPLATHLVSRPRLHARLTAGLQSCCTLIAAPAGWGKTLLIGSWLAEGGGADRAAAWVSLGPADDDVRALWTAVATAIAPVVGEQAAADLRRVVTDDNLETVPGQIAAILADDATPVVLVLDNLHELTSLAVHESLLRLVGAHRKGCGSWPPPAGIRRGRWTGSAWPG